MPGNLSKSQDEIDRLSATVEKQSQVIKDLRASILENIIVGDTWSDEENFLRSLVIDKHKIAPPDARLRTYASAMIDLRHQLVAKDAALNLAEETLLAVEERLRPTDEESERAAQSTTINAVESIANMAEASMRECEEGKDLTAGQKYALLRETLSKIFHTGTALVHTARWSDGQSEASKATKFSELFQIPTAKGPWPELGREPPSETKATNPAPRTQQPERPRSEGASSSTSAVNASTTPTWLQGQEHLEVEPVPKSRRRLASKKPAPTDTGETSSS